MLEAEMELVDDLKMKYLETLMYYSEELLIEKMLKKTIPLWIALVTHQKVLQ